jgi:aspartate/methionine/tyrosine aminotransferase
MLHNTPEEFYQHSLSQLEANAQLLVEQLANVPGLKVIKPSGAMYVMVSSPPPLSCQQHGLQQRQRVPFPV